MNAYVLDTNAVIRYLFRSGDFERVAALFEKAAAEECRLYISVINWGEVIYTIAKVIGFEKAIADLKTLGFRLQTVDADELETEAAAKLKFHNKLGYADSFAAALAMRLNATLVTADPDFTKLGKKLKVMALARHGG